MAEIIDLFSRRNKGLGSSPSALTPPQPKASNSVDGFNPARYRASMGYVTWIGFITAPAYWIHLDDEDPDNDPWGHDPKPEKRVA